MKITRNLGMLILSATALFLGVSAPAQTTYTFVPTSGNPGDVVSTITVTGGDISALTFGDSSTPVADFTADLSSSPIETSTSGEDLTFDDFNINNNGGPDVYYFDDGISDYDIDAFPDGNFVDEAVPEPESIALFGFGLAALGLLCRRTIV
jgi:hypothetical protein